MKKLLLGQDTSPLRPVPFEPDHLLHRGLISHYCIMKEHAALAGIELRLVSSWRSFDKQSQIWNKKVGGQAPLLDSNGQYLNVSNLSQTQIQKAILNWSALPGSSRHHWGTDFDIYDANAMDIQDVELIPSEYEPQGPMSQLGLWLEKWLNSENNPGFYRPYSSPRPMETTGYNNEPWHLSFAPLSQHFLAQFEATDLEKALRENPPLTFETSENLALTPWVEKFYQEYVINITPYPGQLLNQAPYSTKGLLPDWYKEGLTSLGQSTQGHELEIFSQFTSQLQLKILIIASHHGDESEGLQLLSRSIRSIQGVRPNVAIILNANPDGSIAGTRGNSRGVDLNRNWPNQEWHSQSVEIKQTMDDPRLPYLTPGLTPGSEPETQALKSWVESNQPDCIISIHSPLGCIDLNGNSETQQQISQAMHRVSGLPIVRGVGYSTPGSFGTWCEENNFALITLELESLPREELNQKWQPFFTQLIKKTDTVHQASLESLLWF